MNRLQQQLMVNPKVSHVQQPQVVNFDRNMAFRNPPIVSYSGHLIDAVPQNIQISFGSENRFHPRQVRRPNPNSRALQQHGSLGPRVNWKGKTCNGKKRTQVVQRFMTGKYMNSYYYNPLLVNELQHRDVLKPRRVFSYNFNKRNHRRNMSDVANESRPAPLAPRNTTSFLIRASGIAPQVTPSPQTPGVFPSPIFSPFPYALTNLAEEWGVDGYGSMKGLIRLRSPGHEVAAVGEIDSIESSAEEHADIWRMLDQQLSRFVMVVEPGLENQSVLTNREADRDNPVAQMEIENHEDWGPIYRYGTMQGLIRLRSLEHEVDGTGGSDSEGSSVEEAHYEMERRVDQDLSRFEMILKPGADRQQNLMLNRVDDQDTHIAQLEEQNLTLKQRVFLMEREIREVSQRMLLFGRRESNGELQKHSSVKCY